MVRLIASATVVAALTLARPADACGCFTPPDPTVPIVQAGERIVFAVKNGEVTAHVQVQYSGAAGDFGWLLPLPAVPTLELGTDELFSQLTFTTQPKYRLNRVRDSSCTAFNTGGAGGGSTSFPGGSVDAGVSGPPSPLVIQDSIGPYDYAVLRADSKTAMLAWLADNHFFVPSGTDDAVAPYIHEGGYFLALKLHAGNDTGDLQPVVLRYQGDMGVIPITLTSTGAEQNMGVQVFMLGTGRAIPRNYNHTVLNDAAIDWRNSGNNYNDVIIRAVSEAPEHHSFVTEFSGPTSVMKDVIAPPGRFGTEAALAAAPTPAAFIAALWRNGFAGQSLLSQGQGPVFSGPLKAALAKQIPPPTGVTLDSFYASYEFYASQAPAPSFEPVSLAREIWERVVTPTKKANALFDEGRTLTRLYTTISPQDMNRDPAFSFNPSLAAVSNVHQATETQSCGADGFSPSKYQLITEQGWSLNYDANGVAVVDVSTSPASLQIQVLREEGAAEVLVDNTPKVIQMVDAQLPARSGCSTAGVELIVGALLLLRRKR